MTADVVTVLEGVNSALPVVFAGLIGAVLASFLCVVAERVPRGETLGGRSHCVCGRQLDAGENIPVLGWVAARGKASCCDTPIPARYVLAELFLALWCAGAVALLPPAAAAAACVVAGAALTVAVSVVSQRN